MTPFGIKRTEREAIHSSPSSAEIKKEWSNTSIASHAFLGCTWASCTLLGCDSREEQADLSNTVPKSACRHFLLNTCNHKSLLMTKLHMDLRTRDETSTTGTGNCSDHPLW